jgi:hypothetical protein
LIQHPIYQWVDTAFGGPHRRNNVLGLTDVTAQLPTDKNEGYCTWHRFPMAYQNHWHATGSTGNYQGPSYADFLPFDFDGDDLGVVLERVRQFLKVLELNWEVEGLHGIRCYFSGRKGFHVLLSHALFGGWIPSVSLPRQLKTLAMTLADGIEIDSTIYDQNRLLRLPNTQHGTSDLWKVPLDINEVLTLSIDAITDIAKKPRTVEFPDWSDCASSKACMAALDGMVQEDGNTSGLSVPAVQKQAAALQSEDLFPTGLKEGEGRDNAAFRIARYLRDKHLPDDVALRILQLWDGQQPEPLGTQTLQHKIQSAYSRHKPALDADLVPDDIKTPDELTDAYTAYIDKLKSQRITLGWPEVDARLRGIAPGEVLTIIAKSGVGKTAVLQNILRHIALSQDSFSLFCSLEQPLAQVFERYAQMARGEAGEDIERRWDDEEARQRIAEAVRDDLGHQTLTCGRSLKFSQLDQALDIAEDKVGTTIQLLAVDYLGLLDATELDASLYGQISRAARELKSLAKRRDIAVICLCQVSRANGEDGSKPLNIYSARESGAIEESADFLLGLYRPDLHGQDQKMAIQILKNRKGQHGVEFTYNFDKTSLRIAAPQVPLEQGQLNVNRREY